VGVEIYTSTTRTRSIPSAIESFYNGVLVEDKYTFGGATFLGRTVKKDTAPPLAIFKGKQTTVSENHPEWRFGTPSGDCGGPFFTEKVWLDLIGQELHTGSFRTSDGRSRYNYTGDILAMIPESVVFPASQKSSQADLIKAGTTAISRCKPTNVIADLATFLLELKNEGIPRIAGSSLWQKKALAARDAGDEYLNLEFGWKPMVADVVNVVNSIRHAHTVLEQYERGSGSLTRRRYDFPEEKTSTAVAIGTGNPASYPDAFSMLDPLLSPGTCFRRSVTYRKRWFSGAFTYHLPSDYRSRNKLVSLASKARTLLGADLTPEVLWNIAPWSWAVDWFSNAGDVISNFSDWSSDGLVMKYGYVMETSSGRNSYYMDGMGRFKTAFPRSSRPTVLSACVETKQRIAASPFGFGLNWSGLTPRQLSIATALGITRGR